MGAGVELGNAGVAWVRSGSGRDVRGAGYAAVRGVGCDSVE